MKKSEKIALNPELVARLRSYGMNWSCTTQRPFDLNPTSFTAHIEGLKPKRFSKETQLKMLEAYADDASVARVIGISSAPNDGQSKLLAAYLMQHHLMTVPNAHPKWHDLTGSYQCELMEYREELDVSMLVLNNVGPDSTPVKKEKLRDILERYSYLPIVIVVNGADAFTFLTKEMRKPVHGIVYLSGELVKKFDLG